MTARSLALALANLRKARLIERIDIEESEAGSYRLTRPGAELAELLASFGRQPLAAPERRAGTGSERTYKRV